ncbi:MAG TPA: DUF5989 family protein [Thermodesulfovibrionales bacterium]|nr:DUF5989 family protein [Thermodesulfovibrionales bacterium]
MTFPFNLSTITSKISFLNDIVGFLRERKKFWLAPIIIVLLLVSILMVIGGGSAVAPLVFPLF